MKTSLIRTGLALLIAGGTVMFAQTAKEDMKRAGQDTKDAAKETGKATKRTAKTAKRKIKHGTNKAASKVEQKTRDQQQ